MIKKLQLLTEYKKIIIEKFIPGREIQAAIIGSKKLGAIELKPKRQFYDYKAKYSKEAKTEHIMPANLSKNKYNQALKIAKKANIKALKILGSAFRFSFKRGNL